MPDAVFDLNPLRALTELRLIKIDADRLFGLHNFTAQLKYVQCRRSIPSLHYFFVLCAGDEVDSARPWLSLETVDCSGNSLLDMEHALHSFIAVKKLDLSDNSLQTISKDIKHMCSIEELNLNYNQITSLRYGRFTGSPSVAAVVAAAAAAQARA